MTENETTPLTHAFAELHGLIKSRKIIESEYKKAMDHNTSMQEKHRKTILAHTEGLDTGKIQCAERILLIRGLFAQAGQDKVSVLDDAVKWFVDGELYYDTGAINYYKNLWTGYFGTKSYDAWHGQRTDCEYGMGPRHGSIIFMVGLQEDVRRRRQTANTRVDPREAFSPEEREACIYYLTNLERIQTTQAQAKKDAIDGKAANSPD